MDPISLLVIAGSLGLKYMNDRDALRRASSLQGAMQQYQQQKGRETEAQINNYLTQQTAPQRAAEMQKIESSRQQSMQSTVDQARAASPVTETAGTNTSADYQKSAQAAADRVSDRTRRAIEQQAVMGAPAEQSLATNIRLGRTAGAVDANNEAINNIGEAYSRDIRNVRPNPWLSMLSSAGMAAGGYMLGSAGASGAANAAIDAGVNNGGGYEDASGNLYDPAVATRQDAVIQRQLKMRRAMKQFGFDI